MTLLLFGATGMVGSGVLLEALADPRVTSVVSIVRSATGRTDPKLREVVHADFYDYSALLDEFTLVDACFFCLGVTAVGMTEAEYTRVTYDLTMAAARTLVERSPSAVFCYVSGAGTDSSERGRAMWARVKGRTENALLALPFRAAYMFRPGYIQPVGGVRSKTGWYQALYTVMAPLYPLLRRLAPRHLVTTAEVGRAMIAVAADGAEQAILDPSGIKALAARE